MAFGAARPRTPSPGVVSAGGEDALIAFASRYLGVWGLTDTSRAGRAASRVVSVVLASGEAQSPRELRRRILCLTREWVEEFARGTSGSTDDWLWRVQSLLSRYPRAFVETPIPVGRAALGATVSVLPDPEPRTHDAANDHRLLRAARRSGS